MNDHNKIIDDDDDDGTTEAEADEATAATTTTPPYSFQERILWMNDYGSATTTTIRLEFVIEWDLSLIDGIIHRFHNLERKLFPTGDGNKNLNLKIQISSNTISKYPRNRMNLVPLLSLDNNSNITKNTLNGPSGFWLKLQHSSSPCKNEGDNNNNNSTPPKEWIEQLIQQRLITTPISKQIKNNEWDILLLKKQRCIESEIDIDTSDVQQQLILPNNGQGWSVDALQQTFSSFMNLLSSSGGQQTTFLGQRTAMDWSNLLVSSSAYDKIMYWNLQKQQHYDRKKFKFHFGLEYTLSSSASTEIETEKYFIKSLLPSSSTSSALGPRYIYKVLPRPRSSSSTTPSDEPSYYELYPITSPNDLDEKEKETPSSSNDVVAPTTWMISVEQVLRRPTLHYGRLETWIETTTNINTNESCKTILYRQVLPPILTPSWQTLQVISLPTTTKVEEEEEEEKLAVTKKHVQWLDDGTSILEVQYNNPETTATETTKTVIISIDVSASYLTLDDFPGDPNRGRELPPAMARCTTTTAAASNNSYQYHHDDFVNVFSSSLLMLPPVPDMSMPFNVLSLTCSLYAYLIGSILIVLIKKGSENIVYKLYPNKKPKSLRDKIKEKVSNFKKKLISKGGDGKKINDNGDNNNNNSNETDDDGEDDDDKTKQPRANVDDDTTTEEKRNNDTDK